jgi:hypothetical protein
MDRAVIQGDLPESAIVLPMRRRDPGRELNILLQVELVGHQVTVSLDLGLAGKALAPIPLVQDLLREGIAVGIAFRVKPGARISVPVPGATDTGAGFEDPGLQPKFPKSVKLVHTRDPGADDNGVEIKSLGRIRPPIRLL